MDRFWCSKCETWHGRFDDSGSDRLERWQGSLPDILFMTNGRPGSPIIIVRRDEIEMKNRIIT